MDRRPRSLLVVPLVAVGLIGSFAAGTVLAGAEPTSPTSPTSSTSPTSPPSCAELLDHYVDAALPLVGPRGWLRPSTYLAAPLPVEEAASAADLSARRTTSPSAPGTTRAASSTTGTNVQEAGVDEPDSVKTDGDLLARVDDGELVLADVTGDAVREQARVALVDLEGVGAPEDVPGLELGPEAAAAAELLLHDDTLVVLAPGGATGATTHVVSIDVADPTDPRVAEHLTYDTGLLSARLHTDVLRLVLDAGLPPLDFRSPGGDLGRESALAANEDLVRASTLADWLPARSVAGAGPAAFLGCADVAVPGARLPLGTTAVVGASVDDLAGEPSAGGALGVAADLPLAYESADHLYLATGGEQEGWIDPVCLGLCRSVDPGVPDGTTHVLGFALDGARAAYVGAGELDGRLGDRWSMDEHDGVLRLALEASPETADATSVVTLEPRGGELVEVGRLDGLGRAEDLTSVRWFADLAVLVTFRQVDPLHTVDLSDPARPVELGELEVPGFSSYLHPLGAKRLLGLGEGPVGTRRGGTGWGAQAGLFDVTDLTDVRRLDAVGYRPGSRAGAATDPRQLTWLPQDRTVLTVVVRGWRNPSAVVSTLRVGEGRLAGTTQRVDRGTDLDQVRLVPLPDGRVVLVTGDGARFFTP